MSKGKKIWAWRRENGRVGVRNHVAILPVDDISNAACVAVADNIQGTIALPHAYGRLQFGEDLDLHFRTMIGTGANPNVAACIVIGIEPHWTQKIVDGIAATGKPVAGFWIEGNGDIATIAAASRKAKEFVHHASEQVRVECDARGAVDRRQVRRVRHDDRPRLLPDRRQHVRQADPAGPLRLLRRDLRAHGRRAPRRRPRGDARGSRASS